MFTESDAYPLFLMTDDTGMIQHSNFAVPDPKSGYTTDDNARALICAVMLYEKYRSTKYLKLIFVYLSFLTYAQNDDGYFKNFMNYNRNFIEERGSEDCFGRCLWSLGFTMNSRFLDKSIKYSSLKLVKSAIKQSNKLSSLHGMAYSLIGLCLVYASITSSIINDFGCKRDKLISIKNTSMQQITSLSDHICSSFTKNSDECWSWYDSQLTYSNSIIPFSLIKSYHITKDKKYLLTATKSLSFLDKVHFKNDFFKPVGCKGWYKKGDTSPAEFDEQPVEACSSALLYKEAYKTTGNTLYKTRLNLCLKWFTGKNSKMTSLVNPVTKGCFDGITESEINLNSGAESIISKILTQLVCEI